MIARSADDMPQDSGYPPRKASFGTLAPALPQPLWSSPDGCSHANGPVRAYTSLGAVVPHHFDDVVETAGLALHDEEPERISRLFDETIADFSIGIGRPRGMRQVPSARPQAAAQAVRAPTPSPGRSRIRELCIRNEENSTLYSRRAPKRGLPIIPHLIGRQGLFKTKRRGARSYAKWELCWRVAHEFPSSRQRPTYTRSLARRRPDNRCRSPVSAAYHFRLLILDARIC
jgi:hypothetical protein